MLFRVVDVLHDHETLYADSQQCLGVAGGGLYCFRTFLAAGSGTQPL